MICKECNQILDNNASFCGHCGAKVINDEQEVALQEENLQEEKLQEEKLQEEILQEEVLQEEILQEEVLQEEILQEEYSFKKMTFTKISIVLIALAALSVIISFIPFGTPLIIIGMVLGLAAIIGSAVMMFNKGDKALYLAVLLLGVGGLLMNLGWGYYIWFLV